VVDIAVLLSVGRHPASGRARRADLDARALELALGLADTARVHAIHAGDPQEPALREYLGMGIGRLTVLPPWLQPGCRRSSYFRRSNRFPPIPAAALL